MAVSCAVERPIIPAACIGRVGAIDWLRSEAPVAYPLAVDAMERRIEAILAGRAREAVWLLEHPAVYTAGTSARADELLAPQGIPVIATGRGGRYTYHGPGQRVIYLMLDLRRRGKDVRLFVHGIEDWLIAALDRLGVRAERRDDRIGLWVEDLDGREAKIAAIGVRIRRWISYHGAAINVAPELTHFDGIVPCGLAGFPVTSLCAIGVAATLEDLDIALQDAFEDNFVAKFLSFSAS